MKESARFAVPAEIFFFPCILAILPCCRAIRVEISSACDEGIETRVDATSANAATSLYMAFSVILRDMLCIPAFGQINPPTKVRLILLLYEQASCRMEWNRFHHVCWLFMHHRFVLSISIAALLVQCTGLESRANPEQAKQAAVTKYVNDPAFHKAILTATTNYKRWGKLDTQLRLAPVACLPALGMGPRPGLPLPLDAKTKPKMSESGDGSTHGRKLYYLYIQDSMAYSNFTAQPVGQTIVKESWVPKIIDDGPNGKKSVPGEKYALFVMLKMAPATPNTDDGWVYGTVSPQGEVTSSGRVQSCMECHQQTSNDRMFGVKSDRLLAPPDSLSQ